MEEKESSKERLIDKIRINTKSEEQILSKEFEENILCCCFDYDLTVSEFKAFNELKKKVIGLYDNQNSEHEKNLQELLNKTRELLNNDNSSEITQITTKENNDENINENEKMWRKIGFQTGEPRNDFRAGGIFSLDFIKKTLFWQNLLIGCLLSENKIYLCKVKEIKSNKDNGNQKELQG